MSIGNFSQTYAEARGKFLAAADAAGLDSHAHVHPLLGRDGETLALDVVRDGPADAKAVLLVSSACHGVEGYCGSGVQITLLGDAALRRAARANGVALLYLHALNPYGFSWWRRTTHENVDLNRNFQDFSQPLPRNTAYDSIAHLLVPADWPPTPAVQQATQAWIAAHGLPAWQAAVSAGQYHHPEGLFFGGHNPTWSHQAVRQVLRDHGQRCARWPGSTCTPAWAPAAWASASLQAATTPWPSPVPAPGGVEPTARPSRPSTTAPPHRPC
jgi:hypothetical protein